MILCLIYRLLVELTLCKKNIHGIRLLKAGLANQDWDKAIPSSKPKSKYDVIIIGGGGHGLATAYYLAKECGITNVAVVEKGYIGGGNTGRNTTIIRSNYLER